MREVCISIRILQHVIVCKSSINSCRSMIRFVEAPEPLSPVDKGPSSLTAQRWRAGRQVHAGNLISIQLRQHRGLISFNELALWKRRG